MIRALAIFIFPGASWSAAWSARSGTEQGIAARRLTRTRTKLGVLDKRLTKK
jgi:hypothetical protein